MGIAVLWCPVVFSFLLVHDGKPKSSNAPHLAWVTGTAILSSLIGTCIVDAAGWSGKSFVDAPCAVSMRKRELLLGLAFVANRR